MDDVKSEAKSEVAREKPRDAYGHFVADDSVTSSGGLQDYVKDHSHFSSASGRTHDDLLDIRVGNPLARITQLLQDIKKQKAFSFTLKGSLGIMGVALVISTFGIFGGTRLLCNKGRQTQVGIVRLLGTPDEADYRWPLIEPVVEYYRSFMNPDRVDNKHPRVILQTGGNETIYIPYNKEVGIEAYNQQKVLVTGEYDSCSRTLRVDDLGAVEVVE